MQIAILTLALLLFTGALYGDNSISLIERLSAADFEGRGVGTHGLEKAQNYLMDELKKQGLEANLQPFRVFIGNELGEKNSFANSSHDDFLPYAFSRSGTVDNAKLAFVGFGISLRNAGAAIYDDYDGIDVTGKVVIALLGDPAIGAKDSVFRNPAYFQYSMPIYKVQNAALHGAAGIILVRDPLSLTGDESALRFQGTQGGGVSMDLLAGQARVKFVDALLEGKSLHAIQEQIAQTQSPFSFSLHHSASMAVDLIRRLGNVNNIIVKLPGSDPALANEYIVVGAHYDHLGFGGDSSLDPSAIGKVHPGADDNASGVQGIFDLLQKLKAEHKNRRPLLGMFFSAEEIGLLGSKNFVDNMNLAKGAKVIAMLNLDMVGRLRDNKVSVVAVKSAKEFAAAVDTANQKAKFQLLLGNDGFGSSDHASFLQAKIPSLFFTTGAHADYHRPSDTSDKINISGLHQVTDFVHDVYIAIDGLAAAPAYDPEYEKDLPPQRPGRGYGVYFGSIPEFGQTEVVGVLLQGVRANSPAERAGLKAGDILTGLGEVQIKNIYDLVFALRFYRPNDEVLVTWTHAGQMLQAKTILLAQE